MMPYEGKSPGEIQLKILNKSDFESPLKYAESNFPDEFDILNNNLDLREIIQSCFLNFDKRQSAKVLKSNEFFKNENN